MAANGNRVTLAQVYGVLGEYRQEVNTCLTELRTQNGQQGERLATLEQCAKDHGTRLDGLDGPNGAVPALDGKVDDLRGGENRWKMLTASLALISGTLSGIFSGRR